MHLISEQFLYFAVLFLCLFFWLGLSGQKLLMLLAGYLFCGAANFGFAGLLALSTLGNHLAATFIARAPDRPSQPMWAGIVFNFAILGLFKYFDFFSGAVHDGLSLLGLTYSPVFLKIALPLGISFYTFQAVSYLVDLRNGKLERASLLDTAVFMSFWPKFSAGPIIRATAFMPQLKRRRRFQWANFWLGAESIVYGLCLKTMLSDCLMPQVNKVYAAPAAYDGADSLVAALFFTFQIYGDFAGYSLVVIGLARIMGFSVRANFRRPNFARSFSDFWTRWHISLSSWLGDYIFRPLVAMSAAAPGQAWKGVAEIYASVLNLPAVALDETFARLSDDSLSYVETVLALEDYFGSLPRDWEHMTVAQLDALPRGTAAPQPPGVPVFAGERLG